jgi:hypothetical protein
MLYEAIKHKREFGQAYYQDLLARILQKFILYFSKFCCIFYVFSKFTPISRILRENGKRKSSQHSAGPAFGPRPATVGSAK